MCIRRFASIVFVAERETCKDDFRCPDGFKNRGDKECRGKCDQRECCEKGECLEEANTSVSGDYRLGYVCKSDPLH